MEEITQSALSKLIGNIYDCALDPSLWPQALEEIGKLIGAPQVMVFAHEPLTQKAVYSQLWGVDPGQIAADGEKYAAINPFMSAGWHTQIDEPVRMRTYMDPQEFRLTRFYKEYVCHTNLFDFAGATIQKSAQRFTAISALRGKESGETTERELEIMGLLAPHVRRAVSIHEALDAKDRRLFGLGGALDLAPSPIFLLGDRSQLQEANRAAERFLAEEGAARIEHGRLVFTDAKV